MPLENLDSVTVYDRLYYNFFIMIKIFYILVERISIILKKNNKKLKKIDKFIYEAFRSWNNEQETIDKKPSLNNNFDNWNRCSC